MDDINVPAMLGAHQDESAEAKALYLAAMAKNADRMKMFGDKGYYTVLVFQSSEQTEAFMRAMGWQREHGTYWVDGIRLASSLGIKLPKVNQATLAKAYGQRPPDRHFHQARKSGLKLIRKRGATA